MFEWINAYSFEAKLFAVAVGVLFLAMVVTAVLVLTKKTEDADLAKWMRLIGMALVSGSLAIVSGVFRAINLSPEVRAPLSLGVVTMLSVVAALLVQALVQMVIVNLIILRSRLGKNPVAMSLETAAMSFGAVVLVLAIIATIITIAPL